MRRTLFLILTASMGIPVACSDRSPTSPELEANMASPEIAGSIRHVVAVPPHSNRFVRPGVWGSETASLTITKDGATLDILSLTFPTGGCFGAYGEMTQPIPKGRFSIAGTYTQLIGAYPGKIRYAAPCLGVAEGKRMSISFTVPALEQTLGPFLLTEGVNNAWSPCQYP